MLKLVQKLTLAVFLLLAAVASATLGHKGHRGSETCVDESDCGGNFPTVLCDEECMTNVVIPAPVWDGEHCRDVNGSVLVDAHSQCNALLHFADDQRFSGHLTFDAFDADTSEIICSFKQEEDSDESVERGLSIVLYTGGYRFQTQEPVSDVASLNCSIQSNFDNGTFDLFLFGDLDKGQSAKSANGCKQSDIGAYIIVAILLLMAAAFLGALAYEGLYQSGSKPMRLLPFLVSFFDFWSNCNLTSVLFSASKQNWAAASAFFLILTLVFAFGFVVFMPKFLRRYAPSNKTVRYRYAEGVTGIWFAQFAGLCGDMHAALNLFNSRVYGLDLQPKYEPIAKWLRCERVEVEGIDAQLSMGLTTGELLKFERLRFVPIATSTLPFLILAIVLMTFNDCKFESALLLSVASGVLAVFQAVAACYSMRMHADLSEASFGVRLTVDRKDGADEAQIKKVADRFKDAQSHYHRLGKKLTKLMKIRNGHVNVGWIESDFSEIKAHVGLRLSGSAPSGELEAINGRLNAAATSGELATTLRSAYKVPAVGKQFQFAASVWSFGLAADMRLLDAKPMVADKRVQERGQAEVGHKEEKEYADERGDNYADDGGDYDDDEYFYDESDDDSDVNL